MIRLPTGITETRPTFIVDGSFRPNEGKNRIEVFRNNQWEPVDPNWVLTDNELMLILEQNS